MSSFYRFHVVINIRSLDGRFNQHRLSITLDRLRSDPGHRLLRPGLRMTGHPPLSNFCDQRKTAKKKLRRKEKKVTKERKKLDVQDQTRVDSYQFHSLLEGQIQSSETKTQNSSHPGNHMFSFLPSGKRYRSLASTSFRSSNGFYPSAVRCVTAKLVPQSASAKT